MTDTSQEITLFDGRIWIKILIKYPQNNTVINIFRGETFETLRWQSIYKVSFSSNWLQNGCLQFLLAVVALKLKKGFTITGNNVLQHGDENRRFVHVASRQRVPRSEGYMKQIHDEIKREQKGGTDIFELAPYFYYPINEASKLLKICPTVLKKICRKHGLRRWPHRKLQSIERATQKLKILMDSSAEADQVSSLLRQIDELEMERKALCFQNTYRS